MCVLSVREGVSVDLVVHPSTGNSQLKMGEGVSGGPLGLGLALTHREKVKVRFFQYFFMIDLNCIPSFGPTPGVWSHSIILGSRWLRALCPRCIKRFNVVPVKPAVGAYPSPLHHPIHPAVMLVV